MRKLKKQLCRMDFSVFINMLTNAEHFSATYTLLLKESELKGLGLKSNLTTLPFNSDGVQFGLSPVNLYVNQKSLSFLVLDNKEHGKSYAYIEFSCIKNLKEYYTRVLGVQEEKFEFMVNYSKN
ncbi:hypothetical protein [Flavobacterium okayamense]|uniref:Uncharacterized protein n=1 Tax=Flavobacterium okayamense TaxID=2830782 RepID=A0ABM7SG05_9FLAO|nr:hypothetical protein [Flavobacterium okayamense]BCY29692.1 hypothetical protein KK2020170_25600 [Flavobacterium okayamense]